MIRAATSDDLPTLVDVAAASRFAHQAWEPALWGMSAADHAIQPLLLGAHLDDPRTVTLVDEGPQGRHRGWIRAAATATDAWVVEEFAVDDPAHWDDVGRVLLSAVAARAAEGGATRLDLPCPSADRARVAMLADGGLAVVAHVAHRVPVGSAEAPAPPGVRSAVPDDESSLPALEPRGAPVGDCLGPVARRGARGIAHLVIDDGDGARAVAAIRRVRRFALTNVASRVAIAEPVWCRLPGDWADAGDRLLHAVEQAVDAVDEPHLLVPCAVEDEAKAAQLAHRGYGWPIDVWRLEGDGLR